MTTINNWINPIRYIAEPCPDCGNEVEILSDGSSDCPDCGHPEVLPCSECPRLENFTCDWRERTRCSEFPLVGSPRFCTDREVLACRGNLAFRISIRKLLSKEQSEIRPLLLEREYIEWEISKNKQDLIDINRRIEDEM